MMPGLEIRRLGRVETRAAFDDLARLRIAVFGEFPYLYDGDGAYERRYLEAYFASPAAVVIGAFDGARLVGAATAAPLSDHFDAFARPFRETGLDPARFFYFGESVLEKPYRGRGAGVRFFVEREAAARDAGFSATVFSSVLRSPDHPMRPRDHVPLDGFWRRRGYERIEGLTTGFSWKDLGEAEESEKRMEFWMRNLAAGSASKA